MQLTPQGGSIIRLLPLLSFLPPVSRGPFKSHSALDRMLSAFADLSFVPSTVSNNIHQNRIGFCHLRRLMRKLCEEIVVRSELSLSTDDQWFREMLLLASSWAPYAVTNRYQMQIEWLGSAASRAPVYMLKTLRPVKAGIFIRLIQSEQICLLFNARQLGVGSVALQN